MYFFVIDTLNKKNCVLYYKEENKLKVKRENDLHLNGKFHV